MGRLLRSAFLAFLLVGTVGFLILVRAILTPFFFAFILAYLLNPLVNHFVDKGLPRSLAILFLYLFLGSFLFVTGILLFPLFFSEINRLVTSLPMYTLDVERTIHSLQSSYRSATIPPFVRSVLDSTIQKAEQWILHTIHTFIASLFALFPGLISLVISPILGYYLLRDAEKFKDRIRGTLPPLHREAYLTAFHRMDRVLAGFIRGQFMVAMIVGVLTGLTMTLLGLGYGVVIGVIAGVSDVIPYLGPVLGIVPAIMVALLQNPKMTFWVAVLFFIIHQLEGTIIAPKVIGDQVGLHPLLIIFVLLVGGELGGITGMLVAVPVGGLVKILLEFLFEQISQPHGGPNEKS